MALSNRYFCLERRDLLLTEWRFNIYSRKTASGNSSKILRVIQRSDQKLWRLRTGTLVSSDETSSSPRGDSTSTPRKTASRNSCKQMREIQRSDQKLWPFQTVTLAWGDDTTKRLMSSPKCRSVEVINNPARLGSNHREVNCINYR